MQVTDSYAYHSCVNSTEEISACVVSLADRDYLDSIAEQILDREEMINFLARKNYGRINYIVGRLSAKIAAHTFLNAKTLRDISISNGLQGNPLLSDKNYDVTIAHSKRSGISICHRRKIIVGVDMEYVDHFKNKKIINSAFFERNSVHFEASLRGKCTLWTILEAMAKYLKIGLSKNIDMFDIALTKMMESNVVMSKLKYFPSIIATSILYEKAVISVCASRNMRHQCFSELLKDNKVEKILARAFS
ncbi:MAG: 4'-phosphopantetheinyl transferase superfamily protein [Holosporaceae bacterium]|jgi:phosphopantetheinyl transferase|nr:4'-phosphopantetheinyl transferase superfamily protein [Holosporaceae bacterium]